SKADSAGDSTLDALARAFGASRVTSSVPTVSGSSVRQRGAGRSYPVANQGRAILSGTGASSQGIAAALPTSFGRPGGRSSITAATSLSTSAAQGTLSKVGKQRTGTTFSEQELEAAVAPEASASTEETPAENTTSR
ncbi:MAG: hypothetical protein LBF76_03565, partial [Holosporales bacterium]|nr:hypothetical protein [Holosporales bacterium]